MHICPHDLMKVDVDGSETGRRDPSRDPIFRAFESEIPRSLVHDMTQPRMEAVTK